MKMKLNEDIEIYFSENVVVYTKELYKYLMNHVTMFTYDDLCNKIYTPKEEYQKMILYGFKNYILN